MRVRLLGTVDVESAGVVKLVPGVRRQAVLAALALHRGTVVDRDRLIRAVWDGVPPATASGTVQSHVSYLRALFGSRDAVAYREPGYMLGAATDVADAERLITAGAGAGSPLVRADLLRSALALWRGPALASLAGLSWFDEPTAWLAGLRERARAELISVRLDLGEHAHLLPDLLAAARERPFDERLHGQLMVALYRAGRQAEALETYQRLRLSLADELGVDPGPALRGLETAILRQDPALTFRPAPSDEHAPSSGGHAPSGGPAHSGTAFTGGQTLSGGPAPADGLMPARGPALSGPVLPDGPVVAEGRAASDPLSFAGAPEADAGQFAASLPGTSAGRPTGSSPSAIAGSLPPAIGGHFGGSARPAQLPAPPTAFIGRDGELARLDGLFRAESLPVAVIAGLAGTGKTTIAVHWAHRVRDRFPDGQLFVDLHGFASGPQTRPIDALTGFLSALGVPAPKIPVRLDRATALYRTLMAGRRLLIVLDNARSAEQVRPLLPGEPGCLVLVTSRNRLADLVVRDGAQPLPLSTLAPAEGEDLLARLLSTTREDVADLARACDYLPLALRIAAATLLWQPSLTIPALVHKLAEDSLRTLNPDGETRAGVAAAFDASYAALPPAVRRAFRLLSVVPGADFALPAAEAVTGTEAAESLERLSAAHLVIPDGPRYAMHDLVRAYALRQAESPAPASPAPGIASATGNAPAGGNMPAAANVPVTADSTSYLAANGPEFATPPGSETAEARRRLYAFYLRMVNAAAALLYPHMLRLSDDAPDVFGSPEEAYGWLDEERANLVAAVSHVASGASIIADESLRTAACFLADSLRGYFHLRRHVAEWLVVGEAALALAYDVRTMAAARHSLGTAYRCAAEPDTALTHYREALRLARAVGWAQAEATTLGNLGIVLQGQGRLPAAADYLREALEVDRRVGRRAGLANNLGNLGLVLLDQGQLGEAVDCFAESLTLNRESGGRHGQALALTGLGRCYGEMGRLVEAAACLTEAIGLCAEIGDRDGVALAQVVLAEVEYELGRTKSADARAKEALALAREASDARTEALALIALGRASQDADLFHDAFALAERADVPKTKVDALLALAEAEFAYGRREEATHHATRALNAAAAAGFQSREVRAAALLDTILTLPA